MSDADDDDDPAELHEALDEARRLSAQLEVAVEEGRGARIGESRLVYAISILVYCLGFSTIITIFSAGSVISWLFGVAGFAVAITAFLRNEHAIRFPGNLRGVIAARDRLNAAILNANGENG